jgi:hypothetical protein
MKIKKSISKILLISIFLNILLFIALFNQWHDNDQHLRANFKWINSLVHKNLRNLQSTISKTDNKNPEDKEHLLQELEKVYKTLDYCNVSIEKWKYLNPHFDFSIKELITYIDELKKFVQKNGYISEDDKEILHQITKNTSILGLSSGHSLYSKNLFRYAPNAATKNNYQNIKDISIKAIGNRRTQKK